MLNSGILNPALNELISRFRHTNTIVISDAAFPYWPTVPTVDLAFVHGTPTVLQVLAEIRKVCKIGPAWMAQEFLDNNTPEVIESFSQGLDGLSLAHEQHDTFKKRVPNAIGLIRTGDTIAYANMILESE